MERLERYLQLYRDASTDMPIYPLFRALDAIDGWILEDRNDLCYLYVPHEDIIDIVKTIPCIKIVDEGGASIGVYLDTTGYEGDLTADMMYLKWLWHPIRESTVEKGIVMGCKADRTYDSRIKYILKHAPRVYPDLVQDVFDNPLRHLYDQIKDLEWTMKRNGEGKWELHIYDDDAPIIEHPLYNPESHVVNKRVPAIIESMELYYYPIRHDQR